MAEHIYERYKTIGHELSLLSQTCMIKDENLSENSSDELMLPNYHVTDVK